MYVVVEKIKQSGQSNAAFCGVPCRAHSPVCKRRMAPPGLIGLKRDEDQEVWRLSATGLSMDRWSVQAFEGRSSQHLLPALRPARSNLGMARRGRQYLCRLP